MIIYKKIFYWWFTMKTNPSMIMQTDEEKNKNTIKNYGNCIYQFQCEENILAEHTAVNRQNVHSSAETF